ncbi:hypothetical protein ACFX5Q_31255 [Mesorhizobium sp. IMUNJ 23033]|uniref:hypothetical protein n=1 Tax=Mesorhizobium sp. IMUNJ 23033 TaxID=3378039 RepID=UPI00384B3AE0
MPWSDTLVPYGRAVSFGGYALAAVLAVSEVVILALALNPNINADYRAYYIDRTTTCLNRDAVGTYTLGQTVSFRSDGAKQAAGTIVCGWSGPVADGTHSLGETSRLRLEIPPLRNGLKATLQMAAVIRPPQITQRVVMSVHGVPVHKVTLSGNDSLVRHSTRGLCERGGTRNCLRLSRRDSAQPGRRQHLQTLH